MSDSLILIAIILGMMVFVVVAAMIVVAVSIYCGIDEIENEYGQEEEK